MSDPYKICFEQIVHKIEIVNFEQIVHKIEILNKETKIEVLKTMKEGLEIAFQGIKENQDQILKLCEAVDTLQLAVKKILEKI